MQSEITIEKKEVYTEICEILRCMDQKYVAKIPNKLKEFFEENSLFFCLTDEINCLSL